MFWLAKNTISCGVVYTAAPSNPSPSWPAFQKLKELRKRGWWRGGGGGAGGSGGGRAGGGDGNGDGGNGGDGGEY